MKFEVKKSKRFKQGVRLAAKRGKDLAKLQAAIDLLADGQILPPDYRDHQLTGNMSDLRECHIESDWLLAYAVNRNMLILTLTATGAHADLFG